MATLKCLWTILLHKVYVIRIGFVLRVPFWRLVWHDMSKLYPSELPHYVRKFYGAADDPHGWALCWARHKVRNPHHWQHWDWAGLQFPMPWPYVREMVADWMAAGRAYEGQWPDPNDWAWLDRERPKMQLHPLTNSRLRVVLEELRSRKQ